MAPITLLKKGALIARMGENQSDLDKIIPIDYIMDWFKNKLMSTSTNLSMSDRIVILLSKTGSGKSTAIAPNLYLRFDHIYKKRIIITQPRVLTAVEIPKDISQIEIYKKPNKNKKYIKLYENLGYQTQEFVKKTKQKGILFTTTGILLQYLKNMTDEEFIKKFKFIIIDEAHDRSMDVDLILLLMKQLISRNLKKDPPFLILMSATLNVDQYSKYFNTNTIFEINGQSKPIEIKYPKYDITNIFTETSNIIKNIQLNDSKINNTEPRDIIIFMPNTSYIKKMVKTLESLNKEIEIKFLIVPITSMDINHSSEDYRRLISPINSVKVYIDGVSYKPYRRVIVSTNVAETGLTLDTLKYCIDTGLVFVSEFNHKYNSTMLMVKPTTSSMSLQRKGRVGRKFPGVFFPLFTEDTFNKMIVDNTPNILVEDITNQLLALASVDNMDAFNIMVTKPSLDSVEYSKEKLFVLGAIDEHQKITKIGKIMNRFRKLDIELRKMIISSIAYGKNVYDTLVLASVLTLKKSDILLSDIKKPYSIDKIFLDMYSLEDSQKYDIPNFIRFVTKLLVGCEFIELLLIYYVFIEKVKQSNNNIHFVRSWCNETGLNYNSLLSVSDIIVELCWTIIEQLRINPLTCDSKENIYIQLKQFMDSWKLTPGLVEKCNTDFIDSVINIKKNIYEGYKMNILYLDEELGKYKNNTNKIVEIESKLINPLSFQKQGYRLKQDRPKYILVKDILIKKNSNNIFNFNAFLVSILDGFIDIDPNFHCL